MIKILLIACPLIGIYQNDYFEIFNLKNVVSVRKTHGDYGDFYISINEKKGFPGTEKEVKDAMSIIQNRIAECLK